MHREFAHYCLAGPGRRTDQDSVAVLERLAGLDLEGVEGEGPGESEFREVWIAPLGHRTGVPLRRRHVRFFGGAVSHPPSMVTQAGGRSVVRRAAMSR